MPKNYSSELRPLIGGYLVGVSVGFACHFLSNSEPVMLVFASPRTSRIVFGALAVGVVIFLMVVTNTEHPPAAGMALGLVLNEWTYHTILFIAGAVILMAGVKKLLNPVLIDLM